VENDLKLRGSYESLPPCTRHSEKFKRRFFSKCVDYRADCKTYCCVLGALHHHLGLHTATLIGSPKFRIIFHKRATKYRSLLREMIYKDKASYESSRPRCTTSRHTALRCATLQQTATHCNALQCTATQCTTQHIALHRITLHHTATHCITLQLTATHCKTSSTNCNTLQHTAPHCNTLQHTATHCDTLQHTATHCYLAA